MIVNNGQFAQISVPTGSVGIRTTTSILRRLGYKVTTFSLGQQITHIGRVTLTMLDVRPGEHSDTFGIAETVNSRLPDAGF